VILNARGEANVWLDPTKVYKLVLAPATDTDPPTNAFWTVDNISGGDASPAFSIIPAVDNLYTLGNTSFSWANVYVGANHAPVLDTTAGNVGYYRQTTAETTVFGSLGGSVVAFSYPPGHVYRYGTNTTPGTTDMTAAWNTCANVCRQGGYTMQCPMWEANLVSSSVIVDGCHMVGLGNSTNAPGITASAAQFDVLGLTQVGGFGFLIMENITVNGSNPTNTAGLTGDNLSLKKTSPAHPYVVSLINCSFFSAKGRNIYIERGGYTSSFHTRCIGAGSHGIEIFASSSGDLATTFRDYGSSQFSNCPHGYGIKLTEVASVSFTDSILEDTFGIQRNSIDNRAIYFRGIYQENFTVTNPTGTFFVDNSGGVGLRYADLFGGNLQLCSPTGFAAFSNWTDVYDGGGHSNLGNNSIPLANRVFQATSGPITNAVTGAQSVTITSVSLPPGLYDVNATLQSANGGSANLQDLAFTVTTNSADVGTGSSTSPLIPCAARTYASPPTGSGSTVRLSGNGLFQIIGTANVTIYMRSFINNSAGTLSLNGQITAKKIT